MSSKRRSNGRDRQLLPPEASSSMLQVQLSPAISDKVSSKIAYEIDDPMSDDEVSIEIDRILDDAVAKFRNGEEPFWESSHRQEHRPSSSNVIYEACIQKGDGEVFVHNQEGIISPSSSISSVTMDDIMMNENENRTRRSSIQLDSVGNNPERPTSGTNIHASIRRQLGTVQTMLRESKVFTETSKTRKHGRDRKSPTETGTRAQRNTVSSRQRTASLLTTSTNFTFMG